MSTLTQSGPAHSPLPQRRVCGHAGEGAAVPRGCPWHDAGGHGKAGPCCPLFILLLLLLPRAHPAQPSWRESPQPAAPQGHILQVSSGQSGAAGAPRRRICVGVELSPWGPPCCHPSIPIMPSRTSRPHPHQALCCHHARPGPQYLQYTVRTMVAWVRVWRWVFSARQV